MQRTSFAQMNCSVGRALDVVGDPWTLLIVRDLFRRIHRFDELQVSLDIPRNTLTRRLSKLVDEGVVEARPYQDHPPRFEYHLTDKGRALNTVIVALLQWGDVWSGLDRPPMELVDDDTGRVLDPVLIDRSTGVELRELRVRPRPTRGPHNG